MASSSNKQVIWTNPTCLNALKCITSKGPKLIYAKQEANEAEVRRTQQTEIHCHLPVNGGDALVVPAVAIRGASSLKRKGFLEDFAVFRISSDTDFVAQPRLAIADDDVNEDEEALDVAVMPEFEEVDFKLWTDVED